MHGDTVLSGKLGAEALYFGVHLRGEAIGFAAQGTMQQHRRGRVSHGGAEDHGNGVTDCGLRATALLIAPAGFNDLDEGGGKAFTAGAPAQMEALRMWLGGATGLNVLVFSKVWPEPLCFILYCAHGYLSSVAEMLLRGSLLCELRQNAHAGIRTCSSTRLCT
jgi:hypothetical protein